MSETSVLDQMEQMATLMADQGLSSIFNTDEEESSRPWKAFAAADTSAAYIEPAWEARKALGNAHFARGEYAEAAEKYREGALVAEGPMNNGTMEALLDALCTWPDGSAALRFADNADLACTIISMLKWGTRTLDTEAVEGGTIKVSYPNHAVAVCWANRSAALLKRGDAAGALEDAGRATRADPAYVKGHAREAAALRALGRTEDADGIAQQMKAYALARASFPAESLALTAVDWIDWNRAGSVYGPCRFDAAALSVVRSLDRARRPRRCEIRASLVPFYGGQCLMLSLKYGPHGTIDCMDWVMVDGSNGELADRPPRGYASDSALEWAPMRIGVFASDLAKYGLRAVSVMLGQGLMDHVGRVEESLAAGHATMHGAFPGVLVYPASSCAASEDSGELPSMAHSHQAMEAIHLRLDAAAADVNRDYRAVGVPESRA